MEREFYGEYLRWFRTQALADCEPKSIRDLCHRFLFSRTVYECDTYVLDEAYFITWITPKESKTGEAAWFLFAETDKFPLDESGDVISRSLERTYRTIAQI